MDDVFIPVAIVGMLFIGLPWLVFHYITRWKTAATLTTEDENLLDELHDLARRLDDRMATIERIIQAENPNWRSLAYDPASTGIEDPRALDFEPEAFEPASRISNQPRRRKS
jgi:phage shock protein B